MRKQISTKNIGWFIVTILCYWILGQGGFSKYIFILSIAFLGLGMKKFKVSPKYFIILVSPACYFLTGLFCAAANLNISYSAFKVSCFMLVPAISSICICNAIESKDISVMLDLQFWAIAIISFIVGYKGLSRGNLFESQYAFILGAYVVYYYAYKRKGMLCIAGFFTFLANKRIVLMAVVVSILLYIVIRLFKNRQIQRWIINCVVMCTLCGCYIWVAFVKSGIIHTIFETLRIESNGRINIWNQIGEYYDFGISYFGKGIGFVTNYLNNLQILGFANLHNDLLLLYIETGFWGLGLCVIAHFYMVRRGRNFSKILSSRKILLICLIVYSFFNYLTDNIIIYINYWLPAYLMLLGIMFAPHGRKEGED